MTDKNIMIVDVTKQGTKTAKFIDQDIKTLIAQTEGQTGPRYAQLNFGVGFASSPVEGDRLFVFEYGSGLFAVGGATQELEEQLNLEQGERCIFSTDTDGNLKTQMRLKPDGSMIALNDNGSFELQADGTFYVNSGNLEVKP